MNNILKDLSSENQKIIGFVLEQFMSQLLANKAVSFDGLNKISDKDAIVFAGDSITEGFPIHELFPRSLPLYNRGIGGINTQQLLEHLDSLVLGLNPRKVFLLIGTNDLHDDCNIEDIAKRIDEIVKRIRDRFEDTEIFILSIYPVNNSKDEYIYAVSERSNEAIKQLNEKVAYYIQAIDHAKYIDLHPILVDDQCNLKEEYTTDGLHISILGYQKIVDFLLPFVEV